MGSLLLSVTSILPILTLLSQFRRKNSKKQQAFDEEDEDSDDDKRKDKKLVFLSRSVLQQVRTRPMVTGTQIANEILEMYKQFCDVSNPEAPHNLNVMLNSNFGAF